MFVWLGFKISYFQISGCVWRGCDDASEMEEAEARLWEDDVW